MVIFLLSHSNFHVIEYDSEDYLVHVLPWLMDHLDYIPFNKLIDHVNFINLWIKFKVQWFHFLFPTFYIFLHRFFFAIPLYLILLFMFSILYRRITFDIYFISYWNFSYKSNNYFSNSLYYLDYNIFYCSRKGAFIIIDFCYFYYLIFIIDSWLLFFFKLFTINLLPLLPFDRAILGKNILFFGFAVVKYGDRPYYLSYIYIYISIYNV
jgi:hypothetical protein